ncbi:MAG: hypothetical protein IPI10_17375 [Bacteroidetes bacterium]|nr:hypothetical protein [Bacteroidota bacterium]
MLDEDSPEHFTLIALDCIVGYPKLFWVIPTTEKEEKIFELLSHKFGDNKSFNEGKFGGFPMGDSLIHSKPLVKISDKYFCFSVNLPFRNIFSITAQLLLSLCD